VDQSSSDGDADFYYLAQLSLDGQLALYMPDCSGTLSRDGMVIEEESKGGQSCVFTSKEAILGAALEAERFLSVRHITTISPMFVLERMDEEAENKVVE